MIIRVVMLALLMFGGCTSMIVEEQIRMQQELARVQQEQQREETRIQEALDKEDTRLLAAVDVGTMKPSEYASALYAFETKLRGYVNPYVDEFRRFEIMLAELAETGKITLAQFNSLLAGKKGEIIARQRKEYADQRLIEEQELSREQAFFIEQQRAEEERLRELNRLLLHE